MYLYNELTARANAGSPVRVGLIGAGKFGSMFLSQVPTTPGLSVVAISDLNPGAARQTCRDVGWSEELVAATDFNDDALHMLGTQNIDVVVEATGNPAVGLVHAQRAIQQGVHIVMVNVEADVLAGALLAEDVGEINRVQCCGCWERDKIPAVLSCIYPRYCLGPLWTHCGSGRRCWDEQPNV